MSLELTVPGQFRQRLILATAEASLALGAQLNILLDAVNFYDTRYQTNLSRDQFERDDLHVSIRALGSLPHEVGARLRCWNDNVDPTLSQHGFEVYVLNEFALQMAAVAHFMHRKKIELNTYSPVLVSQSFGLLRAANRVLHRT